MNDRLLIGVGAIAALAFFVGLSTDLPALAILAKPLPVFLMVFAVAQAPLSAYRNRILMGLAFSVAGDIFLSLGDAAFIYGLVYFLLGHLCYIWAFSGTGSWLRWRPLAVFILWGLAAYFLLYPNLGELAVPVAVYVSVICAMMWRAACCCCVGSWGKPAFVGALLFGISDTLLAFDRFYEPIPFATHGVLLLYWSGQAALAVSARNYEA